MKLHERINYILLGTLWCLAIVLILDFCLNTIYNFNLFSHTHWQFVANLQANNKQIATGFYITITLAIILCISGLYILFRPRFRKIILSNKNIVNKSNTPISTPSNIPNTTTASPLHYSNHSQTIIQRPPHLHIQTPQHAITPTPNDTNTQQKQQPEPRYMHEIQEIFENNKYTVLQPKNIANVPLSLIAIGTNETLWLGANNISHEQMLNVMLAFKSIFTETLENIEIDINAFIINPTDDTEIDAILNINSIQELSSAISNVPNAPESDADKESGNTTAFREYIETVITFLGNK